MKPNGFSDQPILHVCAPASPVGEDLECLGIRSWDDLKQSVQQATGHAWQVTGNPKLIWAKFQPQHCGRLDDAARAADLQAALANDRVRVIVPLRGGAWLLRILEQLDLGVLKTRRTSVTLAGFSEWTCLSLAAAQYSKAICVHHTSPLYMLSTNPHKPLSDKQKQQRWHQVWSSIRAIASGRDPGRILKGRLVTSHNMSDQTVRLFGGNLTLVAAMAGTSYQADAMASRSTKNQPPAWLVLEDINETIGRIDRKFTQMRLAGMFKGIGGVLLGGFHSDGQNASRAVATLLRLHLAPEVPLVANCNFGHFWPTAAFAINKPARLVIGPRRLVQLDVDWATLV